MKDSWQDVGITYNVRRRLQIINKCVDQRSCREQEGVRSMRRGRVQDHILSFCLPFIIFSLARFHYTLHKCCMFISRPCSTPTCSFLPFRFSSSVLSSKCRRINELLFHSTNHSLHNNNYIPLRLHLVTLYRRHCFFYFIIF